MLRYANAMRHLEVDVWFMVAYMQSFSLCVFLGCLLVSKEKKDHLCLYNSLHYEKCILGWILPWSTSRFLRHIFASLIADCGTLLFIAMLRYAEPLTIALVMAASPLAVTLEGVVVGILPPPGLSGLLAMVAMASSLAAALFMIRRRKGVAHFSPDHTGVMHRRFCTTYCSYEYEKLVMCPVRKRAMCRHVWKKPASC